MIINRGNIFVLLGIFLPVIFFSGCNADNAPSNESLTIFFDKNISVLTQVVDLCVNNSEIRRVGEKENKSYLYEKTNIVNKSNSQDAIKIIKELMKELKIKSVDCSRDGRYENNPLISVVFVKYATGITISGRIKAIVFFTDKAIGVDDIVKSQDWSPLNKKDWYIYER